MFNTIQCNASIPQLTKSRCHEKVINEHTDSMVPWLEWYNTLIFVCHVNSAYLILYTRLWLVQLNTPYNCINLRAYLYCETVKNCALKVFYGFLCHYPLYLFVGNSILWAFACKYSWSNTKATQRFYQFNLKRIKKLP